MKERETASLQFSLLAHGSYCRAEEASDDNDEDLCAITTDTTDDVNIHLTCDSGEIGLNIITVNTNNLCNFNNKLI